MKNTLMLLAALLLAAPAAAQDPAPAQEDLEAVIESVQGTVDVMRPGDKDWIPAEKGMKLKKSSEICSAIASTASLLFTGNIKVEVRALTQAKIEELAKSGGAVNAEVNLKFGTIEVDIQKGDLRADMKVAAPNSTTSISGSRGWVRAPAASGSDNLVTLHTFSGTWHHETPKTGTGVDITGTGVANNVGDLKRDFLYRANTDQFLNFFGKSPSEMYQDGFSIKGGDMNPGLLPIHEMGTSTWPMNQAFQQSSALPMPPPPPGIN